METLLLIGLSIYIACLPGIFVFINKDWYVKS